jgi:hypothetical protein
MIEPLLKDLIPAVVLTGLTGILALLFIIKRRQSKANALDWLVAVFTGVMLMGVMQLLKLYFSDSWGFFKFASDQHSLIVDPVRFIHISVLLILYLMAESFLNDSVDNKRLITITFLFSIYIGLSLIYVVTGDIFYTDTFIPFAQHISVDSLIFDLIQVFIIALLMYVYVLQHKISEDPTLRRFLVYIIIALIIFLGSAIIEVMENFFEIGDVDAFVSSLPTFLLLAIFYLKNPNFVYLAPSKIGFLQIVSTRGELLYAVELLEEMETREFLIAPALTSVGAIIGDILGMENVTDLQIKKFAYLKPDGTGGRHYILFERIGNVLAIIQTERPAQILKRSMRYLLRIFDEEFGNQYVNMYKGFIEENAKGNDPDVIIRQCIPLIQTRNMISSYNIDKKETE